MITRRKAERERRLFNLCIHRFKWFWGSFERGTHIPGSKAAPPHGRSKRLYWHAIKRESYARQRAEQGAVL